MGRKCLALMLTLAFVATGDSSTSREPSAEMIVESEPDPSRARELDRWPNDADLAKLLFVEGKPKEVVLQVLGHPNRVNRLADGEESWDYPWQAACRIWFRKGKCIGTFYTAGY
jgi:hypothetical protein